MGNPTPPHFTPALRKANLTGEVFLSALSIIQLVVNCSILLSVLVASDDEVSIIDEEEVGAGEEVVGAVAVGRITKGCSATDVYFVIEARNKCLKSVMRLKAVHVEVGYKIDDANGRSHELQRE